MTDIRTKESIHICNGNGALRPGHPETCETTWPLAVAYVGDHIYFGYSNGDRSGVMRMKGKIY